MGIVLPTQPEGTRRTDLIGPPDEIATRKCRKSNRRLACNLIHKPVAIQFDTAETAPPRCSRCGEAAKLIYASLDPRSSKQVRTFPVRVGRTRIHAGDSEIGASMLTWMTSF